MIEVDHPATQREKKARLEAAGIAIPSNAGLISADLAVRTLGDALAAASFDPQAPAVVAWLGVVPYLELPAIEATLASIASLPRGTTIVFDYGIPRSHLSNVGQRVFDRMAQRVAAAGEPWKTFFMPDAIAALLHKLGYSSVADWGADEINRRYFADRTDELRIGDAGRIVKAVV